MDILEYINTHNPTVKELQDRFNISDDYLSKNIRYILITENDIFTIDDSDFEELSENEERANWLNCKLSLTEEGKEFIENCRKSDYIKHIKYKKERFGQWIPLLLLLLEIPITLIANWLSHFFVK